MGISPEGTVIRVCSNAKAQLRVLRKARCACVAAQRLRLGDGAFAWHYDINL